MTRTDKTERKLITFTAQGAALLERMAGPPGRRAAGDYLSALLVQRWHQWRDALAFLRGTRWTDAEIEGFLSDWHGSPVVSGAQDSRTQAALNTLRLEWDAGNVALRAALKGDQP